MTDSVACASAVLGQLLAQGVTDLVLAPGSRSAPLALVGDAAARAGRLRLHVRVDERSAGFLALGLAKASGRCVPIVTTSGTAVGNLLPAVMEAHHSGVPLLVVSADRPAALVGFGANQTTEQSQLFDGFLRYRARVSSAASAVSWPAQAARAVLAATGALSRFPGPAQLNVELGQPLVSDAVEAPAEFRPVLTPDQPDAVVHPLPGAPRTLVVCGDAPVSIGRVAVELAEAAGLPLLAEPSSNARTGANALGHGRILLAGPLAEQIERVIVFGRPNLSRPVTALLSRADIEVIVLSASPDFVDPGWRASVVAGAVSVAPGPPDWLAAWQDADSRLRPVALGDPGLRRDDGGLGLRRDDGGLRLRRDDGGLGLRRDDGEPTALLTGPQVAALVVASVPADQVLCLGNSNPIRDADLAPVRPDSPPVFANRGLSGIDGTLATAIGVALGSGRPTTLLCGDLSFVHDVGALAIGPGEPRPELRIVVADDAGGSIFATLEYGGEQFADSFERVFATPTGLDLVALTRGFGIPCVRISTADELASALDEPVRGLEVLVVDVDRSGRREPAPA